VIETVESQETRPLTRLVDLASNPYTLRSLIDLLVQWRLPSAELAGSLQAALASSLDPGQIVQAYDLNWAAATSRQAAALPDKDGDLVRRDLVRTLDLHNLLLALNLREIELAKPVSWLPGGKLPMPTLEGVRGAANHQAMDEALTGTPYGEFWRPGLAQWDGRYSTTLQQLWERSLFDWRMDLFSRADPLGVGVLIAFLAAQDAEVRNLRLVAQAVAGNLQRDEARELWLLED
jgi:vacuolar-type H+-ATPase subunit C/Vma6